MDYVLGNPPYVRVHNLGESYDKIKEYKFSTNGMTDLYITFYELGIGSDYIVDSLGINSGKEKSVQGRYMDKKVDITVSKNEKVIAGIAVKFVMSNYSQNSNNYFENMLGETANLRSNNIPYFQIFIISDVIPYFDKEKKYHLMGKITKHNIEKYIKLSKDNVDSYMHTPNKTFVGIVHLSKCGDNVKNFAQYKFYYYSSNNRFSWSRQNYSFGPNVVFNDYNNFIQKVAYYIKSI